MVVEELYSNIILDLYSDRCYGFVSSQTRGWPVCFGPSSGKGVNVQVDPDINIARVPEANSNWERFDEVQYFTGIMGQLTIEGVLVKEW